MLHLFAEAAVLCTGDVYACVLLTPVFISTICWCKCVIIVHMSLRMNDLHQRS